jgi:hypothetical protein
VRAIFALAIVEYSLRMKRSSIEPGLTDMPPYRLLATG